jgi:cytochrome c553
VNRAIVTTGPFILTLTFLACQRAPVETPRTEAPSQLARGEYLVAAMGCDDCHTTKTMTPEGPVPNMKYRLAGHLADPNLPAAPKLPPGPWGAVTTMNFTAWSGPWGISYAMNLTPDENTGIGIWTEDMFLKAIRGGKHMGQSRTILPPMPWMNYAKLNDDDLKAIFSYLKSLPPINNPIPDPVTAPAPSSAP